MKVISFLGFLAVFIGFIALTTILMNRQKQSARSARSSTINGLFLAIFPVVCIFAMIWTVTGFFDLKLLLLFLIAVCCGYILSMLLGAIFAGPLAKATPRIMAESIEQSLRSPVWPLLFLAVSTIATLAYPIYIGYLMFWRQLSGDALTLSVIKATFLLLAVAGVVGTIPMLMRLLASPNLDEDSRARVFVNQIGSLIPNALLAAVALYSFGDPTQSANGLGIEILGYRMALSLPLIGVVFAFFLLTAVLPYVVGVNRGAAAREALAKRQQSVYDRLLEILTFPNAQKYAEGLSELGEETKNELGEFIREHAAISRMIELKGKSEAEITELDRDFLGTYSHAADVDARFQHIRLMDKLQDEIATALHDITTAPSEGEMVNKANRYTAVYLDRRRRAADASEESRRTGKPRLFLLTSVLFTALGSAVLGQTAKWLWENILQLIG
ncbi:MAG TPA: hypothetical protein VG900_08370 [Hyphomicrobiaceae bacterium]|nr:hypothetical protein [Hyphomicrobiaceae bacterium]